MKRLFLAFVCMALQTNSAQSTATTAQLEASKEAVDIVAAISENLAALIIHHKKESNPELTKHHSIELIKSITEIITLCIMNAKAKKAAKNIPLYDQETLNIMIEQIAESIALIIETAA